MALLVDIGNSRLKWGLAKPGEVIAGAPFLHRDTPFDSALETAWQSLDKPDRVVASNVAGKDMGSRLKAWVWRRWGLEVNFIGSQREALGVRNAYRDAEKLGVDRWACLVAVRHFHRLPACVVDCGTAITVDIIDADGVHLGGLIAPGITLMRNALHQGTSEIVRVTGESREMLGDNTGTAIQNGVMLAASGLVEQALRGLRSDFPGPLHVVFTGGDADGVAALISVDAVIEPNLVLQGLSVIADLL